LEALPGVYPHGEPATSLLRAALRQSIDVLTVDKAPLVAAYRDLAGIAEKSGAELRFCVGGALPAIDIAARDLRGTRIRRIRAILNGTTNFILSEMHARHCSLDDALRAAIEQGIAEPDPTQDLDGTDTAAKMVILVNAALGMDVRLADVSMRGIHDVDLERARREDSVWKLIGSYEDGTVRVQPELVPAGDVFANVNGTEKIAQFESEEMGTLSVIGGASGRVQMAATITKEILNMYTVG
jgi:homoserine dehydrogenase